jgi:hypothetical protein
MLTVQQVTSLNHIFVLDGQSNDGFDVTRLLPVVQVDAIQLCKAGESLC